jgi:hypothetical protein
MKGIEEPRCFGYLFVDVDWMGVESTKMRYQIQIKTCKSWSWQDNSQVPFFKNLQTTHAINTSEFTTLVTIIANQNGGFEIFQLWQSMELFVKDKKKKCSKTFLGNNTLHKHHNNCNKLIWKLNTSKSHVQFKMIWECLQMTLTMCPTKQ